MKTFIGTVVSSKMDQTVVVVVRRRFPHPLYKKYLTRDKKYHVHNLIGAQTGDRVKFTPTRPISKTKRWIITETVKSAKK